MTKAIMIQGAGSNVGKSLIVAGIARALYRRGLSVAPFKPQNMSNNAAVTQDGGEIGRAQALQARAAGLDPLVDMNPVLLKPETDTGAQIVVQGQRWGTMRAREYGRKKATLLPKVMESFHRLAATTDIVVIEGAGSPAEVNLRPGDIANMGFAECANVPVILIGDIDRGGVIAQCVGTHAVLSPQDRERIKGFAINKFRGDVRLFDDGLAAIEQATGWDSLGVLPWFDAAWRLPAEDILDIASKTGGDGVKIAVPQLGRVANFDDLDPLSSEPGLRVDVIPPGRALPGDAALILLLGSKNTISDLADFREQGWDVDLQAHIRRGGHVWGICGGYQMLGKALHDPDGIEGPAGSTRGLGWLDVETVMRPRKQLSLDRARDVETGAVLSGYQIHMGQTTGPDCAQGWLEVAGQRHGAQSRSGHVRGCYLHGLFASDAFRAAALKRFGAAPSELVYEADVEHVLDELAKHIEAHFNIDRFIDLAAPI